MRMPPPTTKDVTLETVMATLPNFHQASLQMSIVWQLGRRQPVMVRGWGGGCPEGFQEGAAATSEAREGPGLSAAFLSPPRWLWASTRRNIFQVPDPRLC